jgi:hypothetical protein
MVRIVEFHEPVNTDLKFDLVDDASFYMRNDPNFYRKEYFPCMSKIADKHSSGDKVDRGMLMSMVEKGIDNYVKKYNLGRSSEDIFKQPDRDALIDKLFSEEMEQIKRGEYK